MTLLSLVLVLRPLATTQGPATFGPGSHALLLDAVEQSDPALVRELHAGSDLRPFTASDLIGYTRSQGVNAEWTYALRFTALTTPVAGALQQAAESGPLAAGAQVRLDENVFQVEAATTDPDVHAWAAATTYEALSAPWLLGRAQPDVRLALRFASPTTFKSGGRHVPVPMPAWVFGSLLDRWNAFAPVTLPAEVRRYAEECLALSGYRLGTRMVPLKDGGLRAGATGIVHYTALNHERYWLSVINLLADFALFAGVGAGTTMGLGQVRLVSGNSAGPDR
jgi:CRISPR-associated endoribonuclease Cas6